MRAPEPPAEEPAPRAAPPEDVPALAFDPAEALASLIAKRHPWSAAEVEEGTRSAIFRLFAVRTLRRRRENGGEPVDPLALMGWRTTRRDSRQALRMAWEANLSEREILLGFAAVQASRRFDALALAPAESLPGRKRSLAAGMLWSLFGYLGLVAALAAGFYLDMAQFNSHWSAALWGGNWSLVLRLWSNIAFKLLAIAPCAAGGAALWAWGSVRLFRRRVWPRIYLLRGLIPLTPCDGLGSLWAVFWPALRLLGPALLAFGAFSMEGLALVESRYRYAYPRIWGGWGAAWLAAEALAVFVASWGAGLATLLAFAPCPEAFLAEAETSLRRWRERRAGRDLDE